MRSIRIKIIALTLTAVLVSVLCIGGICIQNIAAQGKQSAEREMTLLRDNMQLHLNQYLSSIEQSVDMICQFAIDETDQSQLAAAGVTGAQGTGESLAGRQPDQKAQQALEEYLIGYEGKVEEVFSSLANHTAGVVSYYYRINQELTSYLPAEGFLYVRSGEDFQQVTVTDLSLYEHDDISHVGWYYIPLAQGSPVWMKPYYNENLHIHMFSYVAPVYAGDTFLGVVGMDISYETLVEHLQQLQVLDTGYACLVDETGRVIYHPTLDIGVKMTELGDTLSELSRKLSQHSSEELIPYRMGSEDRMLTYTTLKSGLKLILAAPDREINARWATVSQRVLTASVSILGVFVLLILLVTRQITEPLQRLTAAAERIAAGNYDIQLNYRGSDEVGTLTDAFRQLASHLKGYIGDLNSKAFSDALTGVKNKSAFDDCARTMDDLVLQSAPDARPAFALVMLDCNDLKKINDRYGHDKGDIYLRTACHLICEVFYRSPVFRLGGDEFAVVLQGDDYAHRRELCHQLLHRAERINEQARVPWDRVSLAMGMAEFAPDKDENVEQVLHRADGLMYRHKRSMKQRARNGVRG